MPGGRRPPGSLRSQTKQQAQSAFRSGPELFDHFVPSASRRVAEHSGNKYSVIELTRHGNEVRNEVERHRQIGKEQRYCDLRTPWDARIQQQPLEEHEAIGNEARDITRFTSSAQQEQHGDHKEPESNRRADCYRKREPARHAATARRSSRSSAIWMALSAAPFRRLSQAANSTSPFLAVGSRRMRPTRTSSIPVASRGVGKPSSRIPGVSPNSRRAASADRGCSVSTQTASAWPMSTGTRTQVALIGSSGNSRILRVSSRSLDSSSNSSPSKFQSIARFVSPGGVARSSSMRCAPAPDID